MSKHTPGPWRWLGAEAIVADHGHRPVILTATIESIGGYPMLAERCEESGRLKRMYPDSPNAKRIVACVNACEGVEDPADLRKQRDVLLGALNVVDGAFDRWIELVRSMNARGDSAPASIALAFEVARNAVARMGARSNWTCGKCEFPETTAELEHSRRCSLRKPEGRS